MSGWTALCLILIGVHIGQPAVCFLACLAYACIDSPRQRCEKLEKRIGHLERRR